ncbi:MULTISPECIES: hypothetical protein [Pseudoalteromonas]|uniref:Uncharacterized protein n=1 Tax=Pseudoalteromonas luteoviolacea (strain 2ta16) TaxID=1353533 RepID=V4HV50_PSEL2|nr:MULTISPECIES: hypothetical protein [Pseudoalteromonas]ESP91789.1 hypothetical protein PL2TA16_05430 [Pseudoalteromonas luteoviolacea 2ta16]KZN40732.1 hypothetical protein N483_16520 [Pseudoalteromonas luteoviolacea NCIMB 1944]MCG7546609.1 hypothetical protein [Pseudoalteromonas sp. Of7M-16]
MNKKMTMAVMGLAMGLGTSLAVFASNGYTHGCNWQSHGTLENYCSFQAYVCQWGYTPGYDCRTIKAQCMSDCG